MRTNDLRERLADAFQWDVDLDSLRPRAGNSNRGEMDTLSAYDLADVALGVVGQDRADQALSGFRSPVVKEIWIDDGDGPVKLPLPVSYNIQNAYPVDADWAYVGPHSEPVFDPTPFTTDEDQERARQDFVDHRRAISVNGRRVDPRSVIIIDDDGVWTFRAPVEEEIVEEPRYDPAVDECPECEAKPDEPCIMIKAIMQGFPDDTPTCPRNA